LARDWLERLSKRNGSPFTSHHLTGVNAMSDFVSNVVAVILGIVAVTIGLKIIFFVLSFFGLFIGLAALAIKLAIFFGLLYVGWLFISKLIGHRRHDSL
jgi:uncharacterized protein (DUF697 family)